MYPRAKNRNVVYGCILNVNRVYDYLWIIRARLC